MRKHLEGCLGENFRNQPTDRRKFYPDDNHLEAGERTGQKLIVILPEEIAGIDQEQLI